MINPNDVKSGEYVHEEFCHKRKKYVEFNYRSTDGELFVCTGESLDECREKMNEWRIDRIQFNPNLGSFDDRLGRALKKMSNNILTKIVAT